jgi:hypothetical protein
VEGLVEVLRGFKHSTLGREQEVFACMVHNLFDEYRFFPKYPDRELHTTGAAAGWVGGGTRSPFTLSGSATLCGSAAHPLGDASPLVPSAALSPLPCLPCTHTHVNAPLPRPAQPCCLAS